MPIQTEICAFQSGKIYTWQNFLHTSSVANIKYGLRNALEKSCRIFRAFTSFFISGRGRGGGGPLRPNVKASSRGGWGLGEERVLSSAYPAPSWLTFKIIILRRNILPIDLEQKNQDVVSTEALNWPDAILLFVFLQNTKQSNGKKFRPEAEGPPKYFISIYFIRGYKALCRNILEQCFHFQDQICQIVRVEFNILDTDVNLKTLLPVGHTALQPLPQPHHLRRHLHHRILNLLGPSIGWCHLIRIN